MRSEVARDMRRSARDFLQVVWPRVAAWCGGGELIPVEAVTDAPMARTLDVLAGIDAWQVLDIRDECQGQVRTDRGVRGIASRVQYGQAYDSFTIRMSRPSGSETEWQKRVRALMRPEAGWLLPALTCQAYLEAPAGALLSVGLIRTEKLYGRAWTLLARGARLWFSPTGERFLPVFWDDLQAEEIPLRCWRRPDPAAGCDREKIAFTADTTF